MGNPPPGPSWWQRLRHPWVIIPAVLVLATGVWWFGFRSSGTSASAASPTQQLVAVTKGPMSSTVSAEGTVAAAQTDDLSFTSAGHRDRGQREGRRHGDRRRGARDASTPPQLAAARGERGVDRRQRAGEALRRPGVRRVGRPDRGRRDEPRLRRTTPSRTPQQALAGASLVATFDGTVAQVNVTVGEQLASGGTGGTSTTGSGSGSGQSSSTLGSAPAPVRPAGSQRRGVELVELVELLVAAQIQVVSTGPVHGVPARSTRATSTASRSARPRRVTVTTSSVDRRPRRVPPAASARLAASAGAGGTGGPAPGGTGGGAGSSAAAQAAPRARRRDRRPGTVTAVSQVADASSGVAELPGHDRVQRDANGVLRRARRSPARSPPSATDDVVQVPTRAVIDGRTASRR